MDALHSQGPELEELKCSHRNVASLVRVHYYRNFFLYLNSWKLVLFLPTFFSLPSSSFFNQSKPIVTSDYQANTISFTGNLSQSSFFPITYSLCSSSSWFQLYLLLTQLISSSWTKNEPKGYKRNCISSFFRTETTTETG